MKNKRIYISGCSGTGKSTLAKWIAEEYKIPFIETSTKPLWEEFNISKHNDIISRSVNDPHWGLKFQRACLDMRKDVLQFDKSIDFVTDRSPMDNIVYFLLQNAPHLTEDDCTDYIADAIAQFAYNTHIIHITYSLDIKLEDDKMRVANQHYQLMVDAIFGRAYYLYYNYIKNHKLQNEILQLTVWDWETRIGQVKEYLK